MELLVLNAAITGIVVGSIYGLIGVSLNILYGVLRVVNFAHGELVIAGAFFSLVLNDAFGIPPVFAAPFSFLAFFAVGWVFYYLVMPSLSRSDDPETSSFLVMFGVSIMLTAAMLMIFEADPHSIDFQFDPLFVRLSAIVLPTSRIFVLAMTVAIVGLLAYLVYFTDAGRALRATTMNRDAVQIVGVNLHRISAAAFGLALGLAGVTGTLVSLVFPAFTPFIGAEYTLIGFVVIVLGGLGNPVGGLVGGILFGVAEQMASVFVSSSHALAFGFAIMIAVILWRPSGIFAVRRLR